MRWSSQVKFSVEELYQGEKKIRALATDQVIDDFRECYPAMDAIGWSLASITPSHVEDETKEIYFDCEIEILL